MGPAAAVSLIQAYYQACLSYLFLRFNASMSILFLLGQKKHLPIVKEQAPTILTLLKIRAKKSQLFSRLIKKVERL